MIRNILLSIVSLLVLMLGLEGTLRVTHAFHARTAWTQPDPEIGYRFTPGRSYWFFAENDHPVEGRINAMGWRDRERSRAKVPGTRRVAVIGDSFVEAFQVELDSTFVAIAERRLNAPAAQDSIRAPVEVMNFGRSGMTTSEELWVLDHDVMPCSPDVVVLLFTPENDVADVSPATADTRLRPFYHLRPDGSLGLDTSFASSRAYRTRVWINGLKQASALVSLITERYNVWRREAAAPQTGSGGSKVTPLLSLCTATPDSTFSRNYALNKRLLGEMSAACRSRGVSFIMMSVPTIYRPADIEQMRRADPTFDPGFFDADLGALADSLRAGFVPLTRPFEARARATGRSLNWGHWNYEGHRVVARELARALVPVLSRR